MSRRLPPTFFIVFELLQSSCFNRPSNRFSFKTVVGLARKYAGNMCVQYKLCIPQCFYCCPLFASIVLQCRRFLSAPAMQLWWTRRHFCYETDGDWVAHWETALFLLWQTELDQSTSARARWFDISCMANLMAIRACFSAKGTIFRMATNLFAFSAT